MWDVLLDAVIDSIKVFAIVFVVYIILSFIENKIAEKLEKSKKMSPFYGSVLGAIPQCGVSVVASDLYIKRHITMGTVIAVFFACSDEALPIMFSNPDKIIMVLPLLLIKVVIGFLTGFLVDLIYTNNKKEVHNHQNDCHHEEEVHIGCCHHHIDDKEEQGIHKHLVHPLIHSLKILAYVFVVNIIFGIIIYNIGEDNLASFLETNKYLSPLYSVIIGLIPNCASSVVLTELYLIDGIPFGACLAGLCVNAGLGMVYLFKKREIIKEAFIILGILIAVSLIVGYACLFIF